MGGRQELHVTGFKDNDSLNLNVKRQMSAAKTAVSFSLLGLSLATLRHAQVFAALSVSAQIRRRNRVNTSELLRPELVMYEPQGNGRMALVGVDYVVPFSAWTHNEAPRLLGVPFMRNEKLGVWALHIWNFRTNPSGTFAMWNPRVSCALATP